MDKTPEEIKHDELVAANTALEESISKLSNVENDYKLKIEGIESELATIEETREQKLGELSAVEKDLQNTLDSVAKEKEDALNSSRVLTDTVTTLEAKKKKLESDIAEIDAAIIVTTQAQIVAEESLAKAQTAHKAFMVHAESEKARINDELRQLDELAKAQVVVIESQTALQTTLDAEISNKRGVLTELESSIESAQNRHATVNVELKTLEENHAERMKSAGEEFKTYMDETAVAKEKATEELKAVEGELESKQQQAVAWVAREEELKQREQFIKERYAKAGIAW